MQLIFPSVKTEKQVPPRGHQVSLEVPQVFRVLELLRKTSTQGENIILRDF